MELLQELMPSLGWAMRKTLEPSVHKITLTMDSSDHRQYGVKSEGVDCGYQNNADVVGAINVLKRGQELLTAQ